MTTDARSVLRKLGDGESIDVICQEAGWSRDRFNLWWEDQLKSRVPELDGTLSVSGVGPIEISRDKLGTPHISAETDNDLFFGYGFAMSQDRMWQLDYLRRKSLGRLSEILGSSGLVSDNVARTVGINRIAAQEVTNIPEGTLRRLECFSDGINASIKKNLDNLPIEFDLLDYKPETWSPIDSIAIWAEFRYYLTVRFPVIVIPEIARRSLGSGPLFDAFMLGEAEDECIVPEGYYDPDKSNRERIGEVISDPDEGIGSNNWVVGGKLSETGLPILASDPHIAFANVSCWYQAHLTSQELNVIGSGYAGVPGIIFGRNERVAWGLTNNICAQRDLYQEKEDPGRAGYFMFDGKWEASDQIQEKILVKGKPQVSKTITVTRNGPIVNEILPDIAFGTGPVSLKWMGHQPCDEITSILSFNRSESVSELREALRTWVVPTWSFGFADTDGNFGYQSVGKIPIKDNWRRGYRPGWDKNHQWRESIPYDSMPKMHNPVQGWVRSANNRLVPEDFPYPMSGVWASGHRAKRIRQMIENSGIMSLDDIAAMQMDSVSLRAEEAIPSLISVLKSHGSEGMKEVIVHLDEWDCRMEVDRVGAALFESFFYHWCQKVAAERFETKYVQDLGSALSGLAVNLLEKDNYGWFSVGSREESIVSAMKNVLLDLKSRLGENMSSWTWGAIHTVKLDHALVERGEIFQTLNRGGGPARGNGVTVCNSGFDPNYLAIMGANYRISTELSDDPPGLWSVDTAGQSGHPGSPNYCDQLDAWLEGRNFYHPLDQERVQKNAICKLEIN